MPKNHKKLYIGISIAVFFCTFLLLYSVFAPTGREDIQATAPVIKTTASTQGPVPSFKTNTEIKNQTENPVAEKITEQKTGQQTTDSQTSAEKNTNSFTLLAGDTSAHLSIAPGTLFYDALVQARNQGQVTFEGKNYPGLGFFITDIGTLHAGGGTYLLYYINGQKASVGVSAYTLKDDDVIEWKLE